MKQRYEHFILDSTDVQFIKDCIFDREKDGWEIVNLQLSAVYEDRKDYITHTGYQVPRHLLVMKRPFLEEGEA